MHRTTLLFYNLLYFVSVDISWTSREMSYSFFFTAVEYKRGFPLYVYQKGISLKPSACPSLRCVYSDPYGHKAPRKESRSILIPLLFPVQLRGAL